MDRRGWAGRGAAVVAGLLAMALGLAAPASAASAPITVGLGAGIFAFTGPADFPIVLTDAGNYYLAVASDAGSAGASVLYNASVLGQVNATGPEAALVTLPAGNLTVHVAGSGRAALALDFTNGSLKTFPAGGSIVGFAAPVGAGIVVDVHPGDASEVSLQVYDASLHLAANESFGADGVASVAFGADQPFAILVAESSAARAGYFGLSWTPPPGPAPLDPLVLFAVGFVVAVLLAAAVLLLLDRRRRRR